ncbi:MULTISPECIES: RICIN domain-containing protein [Streptomyces]|uniref:RICIN domain-containing protein n=1 Tax=Streptomyces TaxID=1883 RepID=UPI00163C81DC|nr:MULTISPECIES: RICIN domain-containing protein [Streptomyces]MBC2874675.1 RICIN domain-containing protein [Streptomyces sp. TYQ1024]UBI36562.1 RICIN domain-containing protein [Streptomyces mobaraensis]UKW29153.1 RICIN domain-containing protein [Streptomyces sp. TYQ1024]
MTTRRQAYNANQRFRMRTTQGHWYRMVRGGSPRVTLATLAGKTGKAVHDELCPGVNPLLPLSVLAWSCDAPEAQWTPDDPGEPGGPLRWRNSRHPELCLTAERSGDPVGALPCDDGAAQQWWDNSRAVPEREWRVGDGRTRLRAFNGLYLDLRNGSGRDGTPLTARAKNGAGTQRWDTEYAESGDNLVRLRALGGGKRCVDLADADRPRPGDRTVLGDCSDHRAKKDGTGAPLAGRDVRRRHPPLPQRVRAPVPGGAAAGHGVRDDRVLRRQPAAALDVHAVSSHRRAT